MGNTTVSITPISLFGKTGVTLSIYSLNYQLNSSLVKIVFEILDSTNISICSGTRIITNISDWGTDDEVLISKILTALNFTKAQ